MSAERKPTHTQTVTIGLIPTKYRVVHKRPTNCVEHADLLKETKQPFLTKCSTFLIFCFRAARTTKLSCLDQREGL